MKAALGGGIARIGMLSNLRAGLVQSELFLFIMTRHTMTKRLINYSSTRWVISITRVSRRLGARAQFLNWDVSVLVWTIDREMTGVVCRLDARSFQPVILSPRQCILIDSFPPPIDV